MQIRQLEQAIHVIGIELRTSNEEAFRTIPLHWQRFGRENVLQGIVGRLDEDVYAVYTHFEDAGYSNKGFYSLVIGAQVAVNAPVPGGMIRVVIPASPRAVFEVEKGRFDQVGEKWREIWQEAGLAKSFIAEYEHYRQSGEIEISLGLDKQAAGA